MNGLKGIDKNESDMPLMQRSRLEDSLFSKDLAPHYMKLAGQLASSELVPKSFRGKPQDLFICWAMGYQIGLSPEQAMQCIAVINGKPAMWGDDMLALCISHKNFEDIIEVPITEKDKVIGYSCTVKRKGISNKENSFTLAMAQKAGLLGKVGPWTQYPERMLKLRARGFSLRDAFPDALKGIKPREEVEDYIDADYSVIEPGISRTETLKKDLINKKGINYADSITGFCAPSSNQDSREKTTKINEPSQMDPVGEKTDYSDLEIAKLIQENHITDEEVSKQLKYYEVTQILDLTTEQKQDFINKILRKNNV